MFARRKIREQRIENAELRFSQVIANLEQATVKVKKQTDSLGEVAERLSKLREALDNDTIRV